MQKKCDVIFRYPPKAFQWWRVWLGLKVHIKVKYFPVVVDSRSASQIKVHGSGMGADEHETKHWDARSKEHSLIIQSLFPLAPFREHINPIDVSVAVESCRVAFALQIDIKSLCRIKKIPPRTFMNTKLSPSIASTVVALLHLLSRFCRQKRYKKKTFRQALNPSPRIAQPLSIQSASQYFPINLWHHQTIFACTVSPISLWNPFMKNALGEAMAPETLIPDIDAPEIVKFFPSLICISAGWSKKKLKKCDELGVGGWIKKLDIIQRSFRDFFAERKKNFSATWSCEGKERKNSEIQIELTFSLF